MRQYEVLKAKELFYGSDVIRGFCYKMAGTGDNYALFGTRIVWYAARRMTEISKR